MPAEPEPCRNCGHDFDEHWLVAYDAPLEGGLMLCPEKGCKCVSTWSVEGMETEVSDVLPPEHVIAEYRKAVGLE